MREIIATVTSKGQVTVPAEVRRHLGIEPGGTVAFVIDGDEVRVRPPRFTLETVLGSIAPLSGTTTADFERQIEAAMDEAAERRVRKLGLG